MAEKDWYGWHDAYDDPQSGLSRRLALVRGHVADALDRCRPGPVRLVSACAGQGRDVLPVLVGHPRGADVRARLVELDPRNAAAASTGAARLPDVEVVEADAGLGDAYLGAVPADIVLLCGVFGNLTDEDVAGAIRYAPRLCGPGATVIWTRHRRAPDLTPAIRGWFAEAGFAELAFDAPESSAAAVGVHRFDGVPLALVTGERLFTFRGRPA